MNLNLPLWNDTPTKSAILDFVTKVTDQNNKSYVPPDERVAVFDNDGTLWCEKPVEVQIDTVIRNHDDERLIVDPDPLENREETPHQGKRAAGLR